LFYVAYRLDLLATDGFRDIAPELQSTTLDGGATFDEFIKYIQYSGSLTPAVLDPTSAGNSLTPDIVQVTKELSERNYRANYDLQKLFRRGRFGGTHLGFNKMANTAVGRIQSVRRSLGDKPIKDLLTLGKDAIIGLFQENQIYEGPAIMEALANYLGYEPAKKTVAALDGSTFEGLDGDATEQQHPGFYDKYDEFEDMVSKVRLGDPLYGVQVKMKNLKRMMELDDRLHGSCYD
jgi:hypothetical protein